jgi:hypothetical protein
MQPKRLHPPREPDGAHDANKDIIQYAESRDSVPNAEGVERDQTTLIWIEKTLRSAHPDRGIVRRIQSRLEEEWRTNRRKFPLAMVIIVVGICLVTMHGAIFAEE